MLALILGIAVYLGMAVVWLLPPVRKHRKTVKEPNKYYWFALLAGALSTVPVLILQGTALGIAARITGMTNTDDLLNDALSIFLVVAVCEETFKFICGRVVVVRVPELTEVGCMLIMGMAGLGFGLVETLKSDMLTGLMRGVINAHLFQQMWMGRYYWRAQEAQRRGDKKQFAKNAALAIGVPILVHFVYDYTLTIGTETDNIVLSAAMILFSFVFEMAFAVIVLRSVRRKLKEDETLEAVPSLSAGNRKVNSGKSTG